MTTASLLPLRAPVPRATWLTLVGIVAALNAHASPIIGSVQLNGLGAAAINLFGLNAALLFALFGLWDIGQQEAARDDAATLSRRDLLPLGTVLILALVPWNAAAIAGLSMLAVWSLSVGAPGSAERRAGLIMLAIAGSMVVANVLLHSVGDKVLGLDAQFVGWLAGVPVDRNIVNFRDQGQGAFLIGLGCSSVHNMSQAVLLWTAVTQMLRLRIDLTLAAFALLAMLGMFLVNAARLTAIAWYPEHFASIHDGAIAEIFSFISLIVAAIVIGAGVLHAHRRQA